MIEIVVAATTTATVTVIVGKLMHLFVNWLLRSRKGTSRQRVFDHHRGQ
jgi:hypothetical protein